VHSRAVGEDHWFVVEEGGYSEHLARLVGTLDLAQLPAHVAAAIGRGARRAIASTREFAASIDHDAADTAVLLAMGRDRADGRIELRGPGHRLHVTWNVPANDPLYLAERAVSGAVVRAAGGRPFGTPTWGLVRQPVTVHNLGGARMGTDRRAGVVDPDGEVFGHSGLYVLDGAALPGATGANPSLTIAAVAERCIELAIRRIAGRADWVAPERAAATPRQVPEDAAVRAISARRAPQAIVPGIAFVETMRGSVRLPGVGGAAASQRRVTLHLEARVADLRAFLDDPVHAVQLAGTIDMAGLTRRPVPVEAATLHLMVPSRSGPGRTMDYTVPFTDDGGAAWLLRGSKRIERRWGNGPWHATTVLDCAVVPAEARYESLVPTGRVAISPTGVARLLASIRATGSDGLVAAAGTLGRFGVFFAGAVARAYLTPARSARARRDCR
jgi:cholesterol oxidase